MNVRKNYFKPMWLLDKTYKQLVAQQQTQEVPFFMKGPAYCALQILHLSIRKKFCI
jgi:hypothetical protein